MLKLLRGMLEAGYLEAWRYNETYSGTPQGGVASPLLSNIFLNELDKFVTEKLLPQYNRGTERNVNADYANLNKAIQKAKRAGNLAQVNELKKQKMRLPSGDPLDPHFRRLKYVRYADDFRLGFAGPKSEARAIQAAIKNFLQSIKLALSTEKTLITHAHTWTRFLGYDIRIAHEDSQRNKQTGRRSINGVPMLSVPREVLRDWQNRYTKKGKPIHRRCLINNSDYDIVMTYHLEFQGVVNYYTLAYNVSDFYAVKYAYMQSLVKTLAAKHKRTAGWVYKHYKTKSDNGLTVVEAKVERENKEPLIAQFGAKPICYNKQAEVIDKRPQTITQRSELVTRMLAGECELCGSRENIEVHHIRKLKDLRQRYKGQKEPPSWVQQMSAIRRKSLVVCRQCHLKIHDGRHDGQKLV